MRYPNPQTGFLLSKEIVKELKSNNDDNVFFRIQVSTPDPNPMLSFAVAHLATYLEHEPLLCIEPGERCAVFPRETKVEIIFKIQVFM